MRVNRLGRWPLRGVFALVLLCAGVAPAQAQGAAPAPSSQEPRLFGGGLGYLHDSPDDFLVLMGAGWMPVNAPDAIPFKPVVFSPRFNLFLGLDTFQLDGNMLWDIPLATNMNIRPYIGMGVGFSHSSFGQGAGSSNTLLLNVVTGFRYKKPDVKPQFLVEMQYSSGLDYGNTATVNFLVLVPFGSR